jgi:hypothetical protein
MPSGSWDKVDIVGSLEARDCTVSYWLGGRKLAVAIVHLSEPGWPMHSVIEIDIDNFQSDLVVSTG